MLKQHDSRVVGGCLVNVYEGIRSCYRSPDLRCSDMFNTTLARKGEYL